MAGSWQVFPRLAKGSRCWRGFWSHVWILLDTGALSEQSRITKRAEIGAVSFAEATVWLAEERFGRRSSQGRRPRDSCKQTVLCRMKPSKFKGTRACPSEMPERIGV